MRSRTKSRRTVAASAERARPGKGPAARVAVNGSGFPHSRLNDLNQLPLSLRLGSYRAEFIYWGILGGKWWRNHPHTHSFYEVCYAFAGRGNYRLFDKNHVVKQGDLFVAKPTEMHEIVSSRSDPLGICFWAYTLVPSTGQQMSDADHSIDALLHAFGLSRRWVAQPGECIDRTLRQLDEEIARKAPGYTRAINGLVAKLLLDIARVITDGSVPSEQIDSLPHNEAEAVVQIAARYLRDNLSRAISVHDVAMQVHLSERHISRLFQRIMGQSILEYLTGVRIETASQLLLDREMSVKQVARAVGYPDAHYFSTLFGRKIGMTPGQFRTTGGTRFLRKRLD